MEKGNIMKWKDFSKCGTTKLISDLINASSENLIIVTDFEKDIKITLDSNIPDKNDKCNADRLINRTSQDKFYNNIWECNKCGKFFEIVGLAEKSNYGASALEKDSKRRLLLNLIDKIKPKSEPTYNNTKQNNPDNSNNFDFTSLKF